MSFDIPTQKTLRAKCNNRTSQMLSMKTTQIASPMSIELEMISTAALKISKGFQSCMWPG